MGSKVALNARRQDEQGQITDIGRKDSASVAPLFKRLQRSLAQTLSSGPWRAALYGCHKVVYRSVATGDLSKDVRRHVKKNSPALVLGPEEMRRDSIIPRNVVQVFIPSRIKFLSEAFSCQKHILKLDHS